MSFKVKQHSEDTVSRQLTSERQIPWLAMRPDSFLYIVGKVLVEDDICPAGLPAPRSHRKSSGRSRGELWSQRPDGRLIRSRSLPRFARQPSLRIDFVWQKPPNPP